MKNTGSSATLEHNSLVCQPSRTSFIPDRLETGTLRQPSGALLPTFSSLNEWNTDSIAAGTYATEPNFTQVFHKGSIPNDFVYIAGADAWVTKWLTGDFDIVGNRIFGTQTVSVTQQQFFGNCGSCALGSTTPNVTLPSLANASNQSYNITNASMGIKIRPFASVSKLVFTANVLVRLDDGGLRSKAAPLVGVGYTF